MRGHDENTIAAQRLCVAMINSRLTVHCVQERNISLCGTHQRKERAQSRVGWTPTVTTAKRVEISKHNCCIAFETGAFDRRLALKLRGLYGVSIMSTVTIQQFQQDLATWLSVVGHGEPVIITEHGRVIAQLTPPDAAVLPKAGSPKLSMAEWLDLQDQRMRDIFGDRVVADSVGVLNDMRGD